MKNTKKYKNQGSNYLYQSPITRAQRKSNTKAGLARRKTTRALKTLDLRLHKQVKIIKINAQENSEVKSQSYPGVRTPGA